MWYLLKIESPFLMERNKPENVLWFTCLIMFAFEQRINVHQFVVLFYLNIFSLHNIYTV